MLAMWLQQGLVTFRSQTFQFVSKIIYRFLGNKQLQESQATTEDALVVFDHAASQCHDFGASEGKSVIFR